MKCYIECTHKNRLTEATLITHKTLLFLLKIENTPEIIPICLLTWRYDQPSVAWTIHDVRAIEVRLYLEMYILSGILRTEFYANRIFMYFCIKSSIGTQGEAD